METWSPRCPRCGGRGRATVTPPASMVFAGRLRPEATKPHVIGTRDRCTKCNTWFTIGPGTEWRQNPLGSAKPAAEPFEADPEQDLSSIEEPKE